jgi:hypothetical protein
MTQMQWHWLKGNNLTLCHIHNPDNPAASRQRRTCYDAGRFEYVLVRLHYIQPLSKQIKFEDDDERLFLKALWLEICLWDENWLQAEHRFAFAFSLPGAKAFCQS